MGRDRVIFVYRPPVAAQGVPEVLPGVYLSSKRDLLRSVLEQERTMNGVRVYMGLAGWSPGQLQAEMDRGDWRLVPADARSLFTPRPETLWRDLDRRASQTQARRDAAPRLSSSLSP